MLQTNMQSCEQAVKCASWDNYHFTGSCTQLLAFDNRKTICQDRRTIHFNVWHLCAYQLSRWSCALCQVCTDPAKVSVAGVEIDAASC